MLLGLFEEEGLAEWREMWRLAWPTALGDTLLASWPLVSVACIGQICGRDAMDAAAVANAFISLTQMFPLGLSGALNTLCSQARGARNPKLAGIWLQVAILIYTLCMVPLFAVWWWATAPSLRAIGLSHSRAEQGQRYTRYAIPLTYFTGLKFCIEQYYASLGVVLPSTVCSVVSTGASVGLSILLMRGTSGWDGMGFVGSPVALGICTFLQTATFALYCWYRKLYKETWGGWDWAAATQGSRIREFLAMAAPNALATLIESGQFQIIMAFVTYMGSAYVAAWSATDTIWMFITAGCVGFCKAVNLRVSFHLGAGEIRKAKLAILSGLFSNSGISAVTAVLLVVFRRDVGRMFTQDPEVLDATEGIVPWLGGCLVPLAAGILSLFVLDAQGRPGLGASIVAGCAWLINVPLIALGTYVWHKKTNFAIMAMVCGYTIAMILGWCCVIHSDWEQLVIDAKRRSEVEAASDAGDEEGLPNGGGGAAEEEEGGVGDGSGARGVQGINDGGCQQPSGVSAQEATEGTPLCVG